MGGRGGGAPGNANRSESTAVATAPPASIADRLLSAVREARSNPDVPTGLNGVRERMGGTRAEQDATLRELVSNRTIRLFPEENRKVLNRPGYREAGINISGEDKHLIAITSDMN